PAFDGDLRRHAGRCAVHTHSKREYDRQMADLARAYLASGPDAALHAFLRLNFGQLQRRHGNVVGIVVPRPKVVPVLDAPAPFDREPQASVDSAPVRLPRSLAPGRAVDDDERRAPRQETPK